MKQELLAPAGDIEAGYAALYYGADAVYLGLKNFSARATAANFGADDLNEFTAYAHSLGRKVYAAVNTLVQEDELPELLKTLDLCVKYDVDALIIVTEWKEFQSPDFMEISQRMKGDIIFDGRNIYKARTVRNYNLKYYQIGVQKK